MPCTCAPAQVLPSLTPTWGSAYAKVVHLAAEAQRWLASQWRCAASAVAHPKAHGGVAYGYGPAAD